MNTLYLAVSKVVTTYHEHGVGIWIMIGHIAHVFLMFERYAEGRRVIGLPPHTSRGLSAPHKVVLIVADL